MPVAAFRLQMAFVKRAYRPVGFDALVTALHGGGALPPRALAITFDDGYADNFRLALPVLRAREVVRLPGMAPVAVASEGDRAAVAKAVVRLLVPLSAGERRERLAAA